MQCDALNTYLEPLNFLLDDHTISEISMNEPERVYVEKQGKSECIKIPALNRYHVQGLANLIARWSQQRLSETEPLLSASLPTGHRIQIVLPPACDQNQIIFSIRKQVIKNVSLDDLAEMELFKNINPCYIQNARSNIHLTDQDKKLAELFQKNKYLDFLKQAVIYKKNILISGGTHTGKTTLLNACLKEIPLNERLVTLEDVREITLPHPNKVHLIASKNDQGVSTANMNQLIEAALRLRPDRIIMGELRGKEAADFLNALSTGHDGGLATIHASNPQIALMRLVQMIKLNPYMTMSRDDILADLHHLIDIIVQIKREDRNGQTHRGISEIYSAFNSGC